MLIRYCYHNDLWEIMELGPDMYVRDTMGHVFFFFFDSFIIKLQKKKKNSSMLDTEISTHHKFLMSFIQILTFCLVSYLKCFHAIFFSFLCDVEALSIGCCVSVHLNIL